MYIPDLQDMEARKNCVSMFRDFGIKSLNEIKPHELPWSELNAKSKRAATTARNLLDKASRPGADEDEGQSLERSHDALMSLYDGLQSELDIRNDIGSKEPRDSADNPNITRNRPATEGVLGINSDVADPIDSFALKPQQRFKTWATAKKADEYKGLSIGRYLRSMIVGAETDIERRALAEGTDSAGGFTTPTTLGAELIDMLRANSVLMQAGARTIPLTTNSHSIAKLLSDPVPAWRDENAAVAESDMTFGNVPFVPKSLAVKTYVSLELMQDSLNLETELPRILSVALAKELDRVGLLGTGTSPEPEGILNTTGIGTSALGAALGNYSEFVTARTGILTANAGPVTAYIMHPRDEGTLTGLVDGNGQPLNAPKAVSDIPMLTTTAIPVDGGVGTDESTIFAGNFNNLLIGMRSDIRVELLKVSKFADNLQYTLVTHMRADVAVQHAGSFHTVTGVQG